MSAALRAECVKLRTVRSTTWSLLLLVGVSLLLTLWACLGTSTEGGSPGRPGDNDVVLDSLTGVWFGQIAAAVLAVLAITSEYSTRMIRTTFAATPGRLRVLVAKIAVVTAIVLPVGLATTVACFLLGQAILRDNGFTYENGYPAASLTDGEPLRAVAGTGMYFGLLAVFSVSVGAILRHTAGAVTAVLAVVLAPVIAFNLLPERAADVVEQTSLLAAGVAMQQTVEQSDSIPLDPWQGLAVVAAWTVAALLPALWLIARRDA